jgi:hypothetical protein
VSSSSSSDRAAAHDAVAAQLTQAFALLANQATPAHRALARRLGPRRVRINIDRESFDVIADGGAPRVAAAAGPVTVSISTSRKVVRDVLAGRRTMADALRDDSLRAFGALRDLVAVLAALDAFVHGAVRCESMSELFDAFQKERVA